MYCSSNEGEGWKARDGEEMSSPTVPVSILTSKKWIVIHQINKITIETVTNMSSTYYLPVTLYMHYHIEVFQQYHKSCDSIIPILQERKLVTEREITQGQYWPPDLMDSEALIVNILHNG